MSSECWTGWRATGAAPGGCVDSCIPTDSPVVRVKGGMPRLSVPLEDLRAGIWSKAKTFDGDGAGVAAGGADGVGACDVGACDRAIGTIAAKRKRPARMGRVLSLMSHVSADFLGRCVKSEEKMPLIDTHAHLDFYTDDRDEVLRRAYAAGVDTILAIGIGEGPATMHQALEIAATTAGPGLPTVYASVGIHPQEAAGATLEALEKLAGLAAQERCVAVGEIGLDYYHLENPVAAVQKETFVAQMRIATAARKPIVIHCRTSELATPQAKEKFGAADAWADVLELIAEHWTPTGLGGIMHCFSGGVEEAERRWRRGFICRLRGM